MVLQTSSKVHHSATYIAALYTEGTVMIMSTYIVNMDSFGNAHPVDTALATNSSKTTHRARQTRRTIKGNVKTQMQSGNKANFDTQQEEGCMPSVHFGVVTLRHYNQTLGDCPSCLDGLAVCLDWSYTEEHSDGIQQHQGLRSVEEYEMQRSVHRRSGDELLLPMRSRREILIRNGTLSRAESAKRLVMNRDSRLDLGNAVILTKDERNNNH